LLISIEKGQYESFKLLYEIGANIDTKDSCMNSPFHILFQSYSKDSVNHAMIGELLLKQCTDLNSYNNEGLAPIHIVVKKGSESMLNWMIKMNELNKRNL